MSALPPKAESRHAAMSALCQSRLNALQQETSCCWIISSGPAIANALNDDVVNDGANARRAFGSELGCFLLLDRVDKSPQIDCSVLNRNGEHGRTPRLRSNPRLYLFTQLGIAGSRKGGKFFGCARKRLQNISATDKTNELTPLDNGYALDSVAL